MSVFVTYNHPITWFLHTPTRVSVNTPSVCSLWIICVLSRQTTLPLGLELNGYSKGAEYMYFLVNQRMSPAVLTAIHHIQRVELIIGLLYMRGAWFKTDERQLHLFYGVK